MSFPGLPPKPSAKKISFVKKEMPPQLQRLVSKLQNNYPFFSDMEAEEIAQFLKLCNRQNFQYGETIFRKGDIGDSFYLLVGGEVSIRIDDREVARLGPGQVFGEMAVLDNIPRTATALVVQPSVLFSITRETLTSKMPVLGFKVAVSIAKQLSEKLREANGTIQKLSAPAESE